MKNITINNLTSLSLNITVKESKGNIIVTIDSGIGSICGSDLILMSNQDRSLAIKADLRDIYTKDK